MKTFKVFTKRNQCDRLEKQSGKGGRQNPSPRVIFQRPASHHAHGQVPLLARAENNRPGAEADDGPGSVRRPGRALDSRVPAEEDHQPGELQEAQEAHLVLQQDRGHRGP